MKTRIATLLIALVAASTGAQTTAPADPTSYYGVVELGAKGIKPVVVQSFGKDSLAKFVKKYDTINKNPYDGELAVVAEAVTKEVNGAVKKMKDDFQLPDDHIYLVESSGIPDRVKGTIQESFPDRKVRLMDVARESRLVFKGIVPPNRRHLNEVITVDIGSGNSKGAYLTSTSPTLEFETYSIELGTGTFAKTVNAERKGGEALLPVAEKVAAERVIPVLRSQIRNKPGMQNCSRIYLAGGLPYVMTTLMHPELIGAKDPTDPKREKDSDWAVLSYKEIQEFYKIVTTDPGSLLHPDFDKLKVPAANRERAQKEVDRAVGIFTQDELMAGGVLLKTLADEMRVDHNKKVFFSRAALYAWPQGYISEVLEGNP